MHEKKIIASNWKMNGTKGQAQELIKEILEKLKIKLSLNEGITKNTEIIICPAFVHLQLVGELLKKTKIKIKLGSQNISQYDAGAYTGEISAIMLKDLGCEFVLIGHSERRHLFFETNDIVLKKFYQAIKNDLTPILCIGETKKEREKGKTKDIINNQIQIIIDKLGIKAFSKAIIAYEPVWAIGTGISATSEQAQLIHNFIKQTLKKYDAKIAEGISIIYGGSVRPDNAKDLFNKKNINGVLVGGASLSAKKFVKIIAVN